MAELLDVTRARDDLPETPRASAESTATLAFQQQRQALFFKVVFLLSLAFWVVSSFILVFLGSELIPDVHDPVAHAVDLVAPLAFGLAWLACARLTLSRRALAVMDVATVLAGGFAFACSAVNEGGWPAHFPALLGLTNLLAVRAIVVPSSVRRTLFTGLAASVPVVGGTLVIRESFLYGGEHIPWFVATAFATTWCLVATTVAAVGSRVIFGLRQEVRAARQLGQYVLQEKLGEGGMGQVFRACHAMLRRPTAIKLLPPEKACQVNFARFEQEVRLTSRLTHPNTVAVYDYGKTPDGLFYYAMEYLDGLTLKGLVELDGPQPPGRVIHLLRQVCGSLGEAHDRGLIHRDVKPANVIVTERGGVPDVVKVLDFGLVKDVTGESDPGVSQTGVITGTPLYLSPEAIRSPQSVTARADVYALGAVGYFLLTGTPVFTGESVMEVCGHHMHTEPEPPSRRLGQPIPEDLEAVVLRCLLKDPEERPDAARLEAELAECADAGAWTTGRARAWWSERGARLREKRDFGLERDAVLAELSSVRTRVRQHPRRIQRDAV